MDTEGEKGERRAEEESHTLRRSEATTNTTTRDDRRTNDDRSTTSNSIWDPTLMPGVLPTTVSARPLAFARDKGTLHEHSVVSLTIWATEVGLSRGRSRDDRSTVIYQFEILKGRIRKTKYRGKKGESKR